MGKGPAKLAIALRPRASGLLRPRAAALRIEHKECARQGVRGGSTDGGACGLTGRSPRGGRVEQSVPPARCEAPGEEDDGRHFGHIGRKIWGDAPRGLSGIVYTIPHP